MGIIYENIEIEGKKIPVKIDTGSDFALALRKEVIEKLKLKKSPLKPKVTREEEGETKEHLEPVWLARIKIKNCEFGSPQLVVEAFGEDNLLGHPVLQALGAKVDEDKEIVIFDMQKCPRGCRGGITGKIIK